LERGVRQLAVRGALRDRLHIFEVDHPVTPAWKRQRLAEADIPVPAGLTFAPIDFERETLAAGLEAAGFDRAQETFFTWLGVVPYLTEEATWSPLNFIASLPNGAHVVFDYSDPPATFPAELRASHDRRAAHVAELGEPWINYMEPDKLHAKLSAIGFAEVEDLGPAQIALHYFPSRTAPAPDRGGHILRASQ
jgi:methyltransferase (TIGR00027 family)